MGTVISLRQLERMQGMVQRGVGTVLAGGQRMTGLSPLDGYDLSQGAFFPPTVITDVPTEDDLWREEIFGPVVVVKRFCVRLPLSHIDAQLIFTARSLSRRALTLLMAASTAWARGCGRRTCRRRTACLRSSRLALSGSTHITVTIPAHRGTPLSVFVCGNH